MARAPLNAQPLASLQQLPFSSGANDIVFQAPDTTNFNTFPLNGPGILIAKNTDSAIHHVTVHSAPSGKWSRTGDVTSYPVPVSTGNNVSVIGVFTPDGWSNSGFLNVDADNADVMLAFVPLPNY